MSAYFDIEKNFKTTALRDVAAMVLGECLGYGSTRAVYEHAFNKQTIVKIEDEQHSFCNIYEHQIWDRVKDTEFAKWFAPVIAISPCGTVLFMERTTEVPIDMMPREIPAFFTDIKHENFGRLNGRIVCHDYAYHRFIERGMTKRMRVVKDWSNV